MNTIELTFTESDGSLIARAVSGKICFIKSHKPVKAGETWECEVIEEKATLYTVNPVKKLLTADQNAQLFSERAKLLKAMYS